jgi:hypothetical protein
MSTNYRLETPVLLENLLDGRLSEYGITEHFTNETTASFHCLTDGRNYLWVSGEKEVDRLTRYGLTAPRKILSVIAEVFDTDIYSEYEAKFWGFETEEEWDACWERIAKEDQEKFYVEVVKYIRGEPHDIRAGTIGMATAEKAKALVEKDPGLLTADRKAELLDLMEKVCEPPHPSVELNEKHIAFLRMISTHEDDLPSA